MIGVAFLFALLYLVNQVIFSYYKKRHPFFSYRLMNLLYVYHTFFYGFYLWYIQSNLSDSTTYYATVAAHEGSWFQLFGTDTHFIHFLGYPFYQIGISSFEMMMFLFSWFGYLGFMYAYLFFREKIPIKIKVFKMDFLTLILFLPNMHFWTVSFAKGAPIFLGLMMFTYAIINPRGRLTLLALGSIIIFYIRPHVFMFVAVGAVVGYLSGKEKIPLKRKLMITVALVGTLLLVQDKILAVVNLQNSENLVEGFQKFSEDRSQDLSKATSGVNMDAYPLPLKLFTFWFRPLFFDAPTIMGFIISFENLLYLLLFVKILKKDFIKFIRNSPSVVKMSAVIFLATSFAMTFVMSNLGIIMRQKSMVMYYLFFVIYYYLAQKKYSKVMRLRRIKKERAKAQEENLATA